MQIHCYPHFSFFPSLNAIVWPYNSDWRIAVHGVVKSQMQLSMMMIYRRPCSLPALPWWLSSEESACQCRRCGLNPWFGKIPWSRKWQPIPLFLPGKFYGQRSLGGCNPWHHIVRHDCEHALLLLCQLCSSVWDYKVCPCSKTPAEIQEKNVSLWVVAHRM